MAANGRKERNIDGQIRTVCAFNEINAKVKTASFLPLLTVTMLPPSSSSSSQNLASPSAVPKDLGPLVGAIDQGTSSTRFLVFSATTAELVTYHQVRISF